MHIPNRTYFPVYLSHHVIRITHVPLLPSQLEAL